jgi:hypothetical protein
MIVDMGDTNESAKSVVSKTEGTDGKSTESATTAVAARVRCTPFPKFCSTTPAARAVADSFSSAASATRAVDSATAMATAETNGSAGNATNAYEAESVAGTEKENVVESDGEYGSIFRSCGGSNGSILLHKFHEVTWQS